MERPRNRRGLCLSAITRPAGKSHSTCKVTVKLRCINLKAKLLKKLRKESEKLKLIRGEDYQYIVTDSPHDILRPKLDTYYSGTYYCGQELLFDEDVIAWLHQCRRNWILSEIKRMRVHLRKSRIRIYKE